MNKESGFSYIELTISTAIMLTLSLIGFNILSTFYNDTMQKIEDVKLMQAANPETLYVVEFK